MLLCRVFATTHFTPRRATFLGVVFIAALAAVCFWPLLDGSQSVYFGDLGLYFIPQLAFQQRELSEGRIPLWNPHLLCGTPFIGNPQAWPLYPSSVLLYLLPAHQAAGWIGVLHVGFAAAGTLLFLRRRGLTLPASLLGGIAFGFGGALVAKMQFPNMVQAAAYLPWLLWAVDGLIARPTRGRAVWLAVLTGLALVAAHAQMFLMQFYLAAVFGVWRLRAAPSGNRKRALLFAGGALVLGVLLAGAQLLPVVDLARASVRAELTLPKANRFYLPPEMLLTAFLLPNFWGNPATGDYVGRGNFWEPCAYAGLLPFALAVGVVGRRFRVAREVRFWTCVTVAALWLALGRGALLYALAFVALPGVNKFHDPARFLHVATFGLACLGALGLDALLSPLAARRRHVLSTVVLAVTLLDLFPFVRSLNPTVDARVFGPPPATAARIRSEVGGRVFHADNDWAWSRFANYRSYLPGDVDHVRAFLDTLSPNLPAWYGLASADGYEPVRREEASRLLDALRAQVKRAVGSEGSNGHARRAPLVAATATEFIAFLRPPPAPGGLLAPPLLLPGQTWLCPVAVPSPRAALWSNWQTTRTWEQARALCLSPAWDGVPLVVASPRRPGEVRASATPLPLQSAAPDRLVVTIPPGAPDGLVVLADSWHPGWETWVNNERRATLPVNGLFRGVYVNSGTERVEWRYRPATFVVGLYLSLAALGVTAGVAGHEAVLVARTRTRKPARNRYKE